MDASAIGAKEGKKFAAKYAGSNIIIELYSYDTKKTNSTAAVSYTHLPVDAPSDNLVWSSSDPKVASVDGNGMVLGESEGVVTITCESANGKKATCTVTVKDNNMNATESYTKSTEPTKSDNAKRHEGSNSSSSKSDESRNNGFIFPHSSQRKLTVDEVTGLGGDVAQDAICLLYTSRCV